ncbi:hypothetical protein LguiA_031999 [Lonicera macranthoides]
MEIIATKLNFLLVLRLRWILGKGEGDELIEAHWLRGSPHNIEFPSKAEASKS